MIFYSDSVPSIPIHFDHLSGNFWIPARWNTSCSAVNQFFHFFCTCFVLFRKFWSITQIMRVPKIQTSGNQIESGEFSGWSRTSNWNLGMIEREHSVPFERILSVVTVNYQLQLIHSCSKRSVSTFWSSCKRSHGILLVLPNTILVPPSRWRSCFIVNNLWTISSDLRYSTANENRADPRKSRISGKLSRIFNVRKVLDDASNNLWHVLNIVDRCRTNKRTHW